MNGKTVLFVIVWLTHFNIFCRLCLRLLSDIRCVCNVHVLHSEKCKEIERERTFNSIRLSSRIVTPGFMFKNEDVFFSKFYYFPLSLLNMFLYELFFFFKIEPRLILRRKGITFFACLVWLLLYVSSTVQLLIT